jgi:hypothetical protein
MEQCNVSVAPYPSDSQSHKLPACELPVVSQASSLEVQLPRPFYSRAPLLCICTSKWAPTFVTSTFTTTVELANVEWGGCCLSAECHCISIKHYCHGCPFAAGYWLIELCIALCGGGSVAVSTSTATCLHALRPEIVGFSCARMTLSTPWQALGRNASSFSNCFIIHLSFCCQNTDHSHAQ